MKTALVNYSKHPNSTLCNYLKGHLKSYVELIKMFLK